VISWGDFVSRRIFTIATKPAEIACVVAFVCLYLLNNRSVTACRACLCSQNAFDERSSRFSTRLVASFRVGCMWSKWCQAVAHLSLHCAEAF